MFVTLVYSVLDRTSGAVTLCNAGHNKPYLVRAEGAVEVVDGARGVAVSLTGDFAYVPTDLALGPGDSLVLYTDGVTEAVGPGRRLFEDERLEGCLEQAGGGPPSEVIRDVLRSAEDFTAGAPPADDVTLLVLQYVGDGSSS